jgi:1,4-alpha-glucan branching enzyme
MNPTINSQWSNQSMATNGQGIWTTHVPTAAIGDQYTYTFNTPDGI